MVFEICCLNTLFFFPNLFITTFWSIIQGNKDGKPSELVPSQVRTRKHRRRSTNNDRSGATTLPDVRVRQLKDQLVKAKVYLGLCRSNTNFVRELQARIRDVERALGDATKDSELHKKYVFWFH